MMTSLLTNTSALQALQALGTTQDLLSRTQAQVSSGLAVAGPSDGAAYWSIATAMRSQTAALGAVDGGLGLMSALVSITSTAVGQIVAAVNGIKADLVSAQQAGLDRGALQADIAARQKLIVRIANGASFAGQNWLVQTKTADISVTETHHIQDTFGNVLAGAAANVEPEGTKPTSAPASVAPGPIYTSGSVPPGYDFDDVVSYTASATETDARGTTEAESITYDGTDHDNIYTERYWTSDYGAQARSDPAVEGPQWVVGSGLVPTVRSRSGQSYVDSGTVSFSGAQNAIVAGASGTTPTVSIDTSPFALFTNYTGTTTVTETSVDSSGAVEAGNSLFGSNKSYTTTAPYASYDIDNGFDADGGALDANIGGAADNDFRADPPPQVIAGHDKTTLLNFTLDGTDPAGMLVAVESDLTALNRIGALLGGASSRVDAMKSYSAARSDAITSGIGALVDADMSVVSTRLQALQTQQQLGIQSLSVANADGRMLLKLFGID